MSTLYLDNDSAIEVTRTGNRWFVTLTFIRPHSRIDSIIYLKPCDAKALAKMLKSAAD